jgi:hypothetical protein
VKSTNPGEFRLTFPSISGGVDHAPVQFLEADQDHFVVAILNYLPDAEVDHRPVGIVIIVVDLIRGRIAIVSGVHLEEEKDLMIAVMANSTRGHRRRNQLRNRAYFSSRN